MEFGDEGFKLKKCKHSGSRFILHPLMALMRKKMMILHLRLHMQKGFQDLSFASCLHLQSLFVEVNHLVPQVFCICILSNFAQVFIRQNINQQFCYLFIFFGFICSSIHFFFSVLYSIFWYFESLSNNCPIFEVYLDIVFHLIFTCKTEICHMLKVKRSWLSSLDVQSTILEILL